MRNKRSRLWGKKRKPIPPIVAAPVAVPSSSPISEATEILFRQAAIEWENKNFEFVFLLLKKNLPTDSRPFTMEDFLETPLCTLIEERLANALERESYLTVGDLAGVRDIDLKKISFFGPGAVEKVRAALANLRRRVVED